MSPPAPFTSLPLNTSNPDAHFNAWGLYGDGDERGTLNRITDSIVAQAAKSEVQTGKRVNLSLPLDFQGQRTMFGRKPFHQEIIHKAPRCINDDIWTFNSQCTSQWDGLRHYAYQRAARFYNNVSAAQIVGPDMKTAETPNPTDVNPTKDPKFLGVHNYASQGIIGRGILIDFARWRDQQLASSSSDISASDIDALRQFNPHTSSAIASRWIQSILSSQGTEPHYGDILIVRSGYMKSYASLSEAQIEEMVKINPIPACGVEQSTENLKWIWDHFSAVAGDMPAFEAWPAPKDRAQLTGKSEDMPHWSYHEVLLAGWGCPIGELFDLEELSKECERQGRWSFFLVSESCNVPGGVASPPNCLAIF